jgi:predicted RNase H-like HicB family nuclease
MKNNKRIDGFTVEIYPSAHAGRVSWVAYLDEQPTVRVVAASYDDALKALSAKWEETKAAYRSAGLSVPMPTRLRGNKRILDTIRQLGERKANLLV